jgi:hypothetical protein
MALLELVDTQPDWMNALSVALTRPEGVPERRAREAAAQLAERPPEGRPRRISDDLAWLRQAFEDPPGHGLRPLEATAAVGAWEPASEEPLPHLCRLRDRGILDAAGFLLHEPGEAHVGSTPEE